MDVCEPWLVCEASTASAHAAARVCLEGGFFPRLCCSRPFCLSQKRVSAGGSAPAPLARGDPRGPRLALWRATAVHIRPGEDLSQDAAASGITAGGAGVCSPEPVCILWAAPWALRAPPVAWHRGRTPASPSAAPGSVPSSSIGPRVGCWLRVLVGVSTAASGGGWLGDRGASHSVSGRERSDVGHLAPPPSGKAGCKGTQ